MSRLRPRFRPRAILIVAAQLALGIWLQTVVQLHLNYLGVADFHAFAERNCLADRAEPIGARAIASLTAQQKDRLSTEYQSDLLRQADFHRQLKRKYEYAAAHPWDLVEPDPPPPE